MYLKLFSCFGYLEYISMGHYFCDVEGSNLVCKKNKKNKKFTVSMCYNFFFFFFFFLTKVFIELYQSLVCRVI